MGRELKGRKYLYSGPRKRQETIIEAETVSIKDISTLTVGLRMFDLDGLIANKITYLAWQELKYGCSEYWNFSQNWVSILSALRRILLG